MFELNQQDMAKFVGKVPEIKRMVTGMYSLDHAFVGRREVVGVPIVPTELYGPNHCGKSTLAYCVGARVATLIGRDMLLADLEGFDPDFLQYVLGFAGFGSGFNMHLISESTDEEALDNLVDALRDVKKNIGVAIFDSIGAVSPLSELDGAHGDANMGRRAKLMAQHQRKMAHLVRSDPKLVFYINHMYANLGHPGMSTPGGDVTKYLCLVRLAIKRKEDFPDGSYVIEGRVVKNRLGLRERKFWVFMLSGCGIHRGMTALYDCIQYGLLVKPKSARSYKWKDTDDKIMALAKYAEVAQGGHTPEVMQAFQPFVDALEAADTRVQDVETEDESDDDPVKEER